MKKGEIMSNVPDARGRILSAAVKVFAEKSFEGSRIADIAKIANVPNSLIYYHFKNKDDILEVLIKNVLDEYSQLLQIAKNDSHSNKTKTIADRIENHYWGFALKNVDLIRIMLIESLKKSADMPSIFKAVEELIKNDSEVIKANDYSIHERLVAEFFTIQVPIFIFLCFKKQWCDYFNIAEEDLNRLFTNLIAETHGAYHKNRIE